MRAQVMDILPHIGCTPCVRKALSARPNGERITLLIAAQDHATRALENPSPKHTQSLALDARGARCPHPHARAVRAASLQSAPSSYISTRTTALHPRCVKSSAHSPPSCGRMRTHRAQTRRAVSPSSQARTLSLLSPLCAALHGDLSSLTLIPTPPLHDAHTEV